jgi:HEPN domain-containing protein
MPGRDPTHWLHRLTADEWLRAAEGELARAERALAARQQRAGVAQARRAAGMALNALLALAEDERYGRSYMEHLERLAVDEAVLAPVREAARALLSAKLALEVIPLGKGDTGPAQAARLVLEHARQRVAPTAKA